MNVAGKLALVVALILGCAAAWKRYRGGMPQIGQTAAQPVKVTSTVPLGPQRYLHVVSVGGRQLLLASSPQTVSLIATLDSQSELIEAHAARSDARNSVEAVDDSLAAFEDPADVAGSPADRFEELMLRLRELESGTAGQVLSSDPRAARDQPAPRGARPSEPGAHSNAARRGIPRPHEAARVPDMAERRPLIEDSADSRGWETRERAGALAPGSLFRSPARVRREGGDA